jgi:hypothetical protein
MKYDLERRVLNARGVSTTERMVMLALVFHLNDNTGQCNPSHELLQAECELTDKGLSGVLKRLEARAWIKWTRGSGRGNYPNFELFPEELKGERCSPFSEEKANDVRLLGEVKGERASPFMGEKANVVPEKANVVPLPPYERLRTISSSTTTTCEADFQNASKTGAAAQAKPPEDVLSLSILEACDLEADSFSFMAKARRARLLESLGAVTVWLLRLFPDRETAAREVTRRFREWDKPDPPVINQIRTDWKRMERIIHHQTQTQNATDPNLNGSGPSRPKPQNEFARKAADRRAARAELRDKYAGDGRPSGDGAEG